MIIKNTNKTVFANGNTTDIIKTVMYAYEIETDPQIKELADKLKGENDTETCRNIFNYLVKNIKYKADSEGNAGELIKSPARLIVDGTGDCKSYSLFTAVILRWLGIPHVFRFVSYSNAKEATHVYIVATTNYKLPTTNYIVIDAVAGTQLGYPFNQEKKYNYKCDMSNSGTKISYLAGFGNANSNRVGAVDKNRYKVWIGSDSEAGITPGKHFLYALLDYHIEMLNISRSTKDQLYWLDRLDVIATLIHGYNHVGGNTDEFKAIAFIVCCMVADGRFRSLELNVDNRYNNLDDIYTIVEQHYHNGYAFSKHDPEFWEMVNTEVLPYNKIVNRGISGISATETEMVSKMKEAGIYYIYLFVPESDRGKLPAVVQTKLGKQSKTFNWMDDVNTYQSTSAMQLTIRSGIVARTGKTPEQFLADLQAGKDVKDISIGFIDPASVLLYISIITGLIAIFKFLFPPKSTKPSDSEITSGTFDPNTDFSNGGSGNGTSTSSFSSLALPIALVGATVFGFFKIKK